MASMQAIMVSGKQGVSPHGLMHSRGQEGQYSNAVRSVLRRIVCPGRHFLSCHAGLMVGPALLGWIADMTSVQTALQVNAVAMIAVVAYFGLAAQETKHIRVRAEQERRAAIVAA